MASATASSAVGYNVIADQQYSSVVGQYNEADRVGTLFVVGNGESDAARSNAFEVSTDGALVNGDLEVGGVLSVQGSNILQIFAGLQAQIDALQAENAAQANLISELQGSSVGIEGLNNYLSVDESTNTLIISSGENTLGGENQVTLWINGEITVDGLIN